MEINEHIIYLNGDFDKTQTKPTGCMANSRSFQEEYVLNNSNSTVDDEVEYPKAKWD
jgi:hypothetical protein